jgi:hypothetical protein
MRSCTSFIDVNITIGMLLSSFLICVREGERERARVHGQADGHEASSFEHRQKARTEPSSKSTDRPMVTRLQALNPLQRFALSVCVDCVPMLTVCLC